MLQCCELNKWIPFTSSYSQRQISQNQNCLHGEMLLEGSEKSSIYLFRLFSMHFMTSLDSASTERWHKAPAGTVWLMGLFGAAPLFFLKSTTLSLVPLWLSHFRPSLSKHLWARHSPAVSRQLSRGAVGCQGADEVPGAAAQGLRLLQHLAEEVVPAIGHLALWRAWGPVRGSEEHQPHRPEKVCVITNSRSSAWKFILLLPTMGLNVRGIN